MALPREAARHRRRSGNGRAVESCLRLIPHKKKRTAGSSVRDKMVLDGTGGYHLCSLAEDGKTVPFRVNQIQS